jgi:hypothetical protein
MRLTFLVVLTALVLPSAALAHSGVSVLQPGEAFAVYEMKALVPDAEGIYRMGVVNFNTLRDGGTLVFMALDPANKTDVAEARRFLALVKKLRNTHAFYVLPPARSMRPSEIVSIVQKLKLELPFIVDDRDYFPFAFQYGLAETPRYELFDRTQTLVIRGAHALNQRMPSQLTLAEAIRDLDEGKIIPQATFASTHKENIQPPEQ